MSSKCFFTRFDKKKYSTQRRRFCQICAKTRGYNKHFKLCRVHLISMFHKGLVPGVKKSSF